MSLYCMPISLRGTWMSQTKKKKKKRPKSGLQIWYQMANAADFYFFCLWFVCLDMCSEEKEKNWWEKILNHILFFHKSGQFK